MNRQRGTENPYGRGEGIVLPDLDEDTSDEDTVARSAEEHRKFMEEVNIKPPMMLEGEEPVLIAGKELLEKRAQEAKEAEMDSIQDLPEDAYEPLDTPQDAPNREDTQRPPQTGKLDEIFSRMNTDVGMGKPPAKATLTGEHNPVVQDSLDERDGKTTQQGEAAA